MPLMHAEDLECGRLCLAEFNKLVAECDAKRHEMKSVFEINVKFAKDHLIPLEKFGRYPTRNKVLGRENTPEEIEYLKTAGGWGQ